MVVVVGVAVLLLLLLLLPLLRQVDQDIFKDPISPSSGTTICLLDLLLHQFLLLLPQRLPSTIVSNIIRS